VNKYIYINSFKHIPYISNKCSFLLLTWMIQDGRKKESWLNAVQGNLTKDVRPNCINILINCKTTVLIKYLFLLLKHLKRYHLTLLFLKKLGGCHIWRSWAKTFPIMILKVFKWI